jgi:hypothetical protein
VKYATAVKRTELGIERRCFACGEWWPQDETFWYLSRGKVMGRCRACWVEFNASRRPKKVAA